MAALEASAGRAAVTRAAPPSRRRLPLGARLTRRLKLDPRSKRDLRHLQARCAALAVVYSRRRPRFGGPRPTGCRWDGASYVCSDPNATRERQQTARGGRGFSMLRPSWLTDFTWLYCEKDPDLTAKTAGRCPTESEDEVACPGCTQCSRLYCRECRNRTGNVLSAAIGSRTFKRAECVFTLYYAGYV